MCGIAGKISLGGKEVSPKAIESMNLALIHRGPDDGGIYISPDRSVGLGHRRLSIIDLSPLGHQPMRYLDRYEIVFNGEIYNFQEKRDLLEKEGYTFHSHSDTEVILALYDRYREHCLDHLRGMFAFAIYDEQEKILFAARDRIGKKPFKYFFDGQTFLFASELKAILTQPEYVREPDFEAIHHFLTLQYVPAPMTGFVGIRKLEPAHFLMLNLQTRDLKKHRYWKLDYSQKLELPEKEWSKKILEALDESVRLRMISDVPIGAFLSGGIDSSAVVALMARHCDRPVKTFSIGFEEERFNELPYARMIAKRFHTDHTEFVVKPDAMDILPFLVRQYEEPYADSSALPTYFLSKMTREHVTVALNGDGGDENFAGYYSSQILKATLMQESLRSIHRLFTVPISRFLAQHSRSNFLNKIFKFSLMLSEPFPRRFGRLMSHFDSSLKSHLETTFFKNQGAHGDTLELFSRLSEESGVSDPLDSILFTDINSYLPGCLMPKVDIATMSVGLEGRSPLLDHRFLELTATLPSSLKLKGLTQKKYIFKEALRDILPPDILFRKKKGFGIPLDSWFRKELKSFTFDVLLCDRAKRRNLFVPKEVRTLLTDHVEGIRNNGALLWDLLLLELWFREYFD